VRREALRSGESGVLGIVQFRATGGGAYKFADLFKEKLGVTLKKEDEVDCLVGGCNFLLKAIWHEAFEFHNSECHFMSHKKGVSPLRAPHLESHEAHIPNPPCIGSMPVGIYMPLQWTLRFHDIPRPCVSRQWASVSPFGSSHRTNPMCGANRTG
jgi:hypothetical protein